MKRNTSKMLIATATLTLLNACVSAQTADLRDPYENWNRKVQSFNDGLDGYVLKPVAQGYKWAMPDFADQGVSNFFSNVEDVGVILNSALQGKFIQTGSDSARLVVNTTAGLGGLFDVASLIDLPKHNENFDKTLGVWGVGTGSYLVLPIFGPSSMRGIAGIAGEMVTNPLQYVSGMGVVSVVDIVDKRSDMLVMDKVVNEAATDRYEFFKNMYLSPDIPMDELDNK
jgi:phospholipid-binding lipoprotein MlaA